MYTCIFYIDNVHFLSLCIYKQLSLERRKTFCGALLCSDCYLYVLVVAHSDKVTDVKFSLTCEWVLSTSIDRYFQWHCSETGRRLGAHKLTAQCLCLQYPLHIHNLACLVRLYPIFLSSNPHPKIYCTTDIP